MLLLENLLVRFREWRDQSEDPDLIPRFRRVWKARPDGRRDGLPLPPPRRLVFRPGEPARLPRAG